MRTHEHAGDDIAEDDRLAQAVHEHAGEKRGDHEKDDVCCYAHDGFRKVGGSTFCELYLFCNWSRLNSYLKEKGGPDTGGGKDRFGPDYRLKSRLPGSLFARSGHHLQSFADRVID
jgi:hypothetical protein